MVLSIFVEIFFANTPIPFVNFLAHIMLSGENPALIMGNFCGDHIKGKLDSEQKKQFSGDFLKGVRLHRFIDNFTDTDEIVRRTVKDLSLFYGRGAAVANDIIFDHLLAKNFPILHRKNLREAVNAFYEVYGSHQWMVPASMRPLAQALIENDWLFKYKNWETVERTFRSMSKRYLFLSGFSEPQAVLEKDLARYEAYFFDFYPRLQAGVSLYLNGVDEQ